MSNEKNTPEMTDAPQTGTKQKDAPALVKKIGNPILSDSHPDSLKSRLFFHVLTCKKLCNRHTFWMFHIQA
jgi:hypothetical protein